MMSVTDHDTTEATEQAKQKALNAAHPKETTFSRSLVNA
jgi:predicted metal-dependent phosphoesterase TrpH